MTNPAIKKAVVLLSGGLDSTTCLAYARSNDYACYALSMDYGQKHRAELNAAKTIATTFSVVRHDIISLPIHHWGGSALTDETISVPKHSGSGSIPLTYVPARNTLLLSLALSFAEVIDACAIFIGVSAVDYSGYPDCRPAYIQAFQNMANLATKKGVEGTLIDIKTPLIHLSKAETIKLGESLQVDYALTVSCYQATDEGLACGTCDSCYLRKKGFDDAGLPDPTLYVKFK